MEACSSIVHISSNTQNTHTHITVKSPFQASTLDGVLELQNEHFWTIAFGSYVSATVESDHLMQ